MIDLLKQHPRAQAKIGPGSRRSPSTGSSASRRCYFVVRSDGTCEDLSLRRLARLSRVRQGPGDDRDVRLRPGAAALSQSPGQRPCSQGCGLTKPAWQSRQVAVRKASHGWGKAAQAKQVKAWEAWQPRPGLALSGPARHGPAGTTRAAGGRAMDPAACSSTDTVRFWYTLARWRSRRHARTRPGARRSGRGSG